MTNFQKENVTSVQVFQNTQFGEVRIVEINDKIHFVGIDVARALGYKNVNDAISRHCRGCVKHAVMDKLGRNQETMIIPEGDLYRLAAKSELQGAEEFEAWIFDEVLPSIRKTGGYIAAKIDDTPEAIMARALFIAKDTLERVEAEKQRLLLTTEEQSKQLKEAAPKVQYYEDVLSSKSRISVNSIALCLGISAIKLNKLLCDWGVQYSQSGVYFIASKYRDLGLGCHYPHTYTDQYTGVQHTKQHLYWTEAGKKFILWIYEKKNPKTA